MKQKQNNQVSLSIGLLISLFSFSIIHLLFSAYVLKTLWDWFVIPFLSLPPMTYTTAIGVLLILLLFRNPRSDGSDEDTEAIFQRIASLYIKNLILLLIGFIVILIGG